MALGFFDVDIGHLNSVWTVMGLGPIWNFSEFVSQRNHSFHYHLFTLRV